MGPVAGVLLITAACCHAAWNFFAKRAGDSGPAFVWLASTVSMVLYLPVAAIVVARDGMPSWQIGLLAVVVS